MSFIKKFFLTEGEQFKTIKTNKGKQGPKVEPVMLLDIRTPVAEYAVEVRTFPCVLGRKRGAAQVVLDDSAVSRVHATISYHDGGFAITDNGSENGLTVSGVAVQRGASRPLYESDAVQMGRSMVVVSRIILPKL